MGNISTDTNGFCDRRITRKSDSAQNISEPLLMSGNEPATDVNSVHLNPIGNEHIRVATRGERAFKGNLQPQLECAYPNRCPRFARTMMQLCYD